MSEECPECGGLDWSTASDGLGDVASVAAVCLGCGYVTSEVVDLSAKVTPPDNPTPTDLSGGRA